MAMKSAIAATVLACLFAGTAQAEDFTFDAAANPATTVGGPDMRGNLAMGTTWTGTSTVTWADGRKATDKYTCVMVTQPVNDKIFDSHGICDATGADGTYSSIWGCQFVSKDGRSTACWGGLVGRSGKFAGRGGTITFAGKDGNGHGTGSWGDAAK
ncbi:MAG: hypothetical protein ACKOQ3_04435 [Novosphingobium sp.]